MDEAKTLSSSSVSDRVVFERLTPLVVLGYMVATGILLGAMFFLATTWLNQPFIGMFLDPGMVVGNSQHQYFSLGVQTDPMSQFQNNELVEINGQDIHSAENLMQALSPLEAGDQAEVVLRARSGHILTKTVTITQLTTIEKIMYFFLPFIVAVIFLGVGFWTVRTRLDDSSALVFSVLAASIAFALGGWFDVWSTQRLTVLWLIAIGVAGGSMIHFAFIFPRPLRFFHQLPWLKFVGYALGGVLAGLSISALSNESNPFALSATWRSLFYFAAGSVLMFVVLIVIRRFSSNSPVEMEQTRIVLWGSGLSLLPLVIYLISQLEILSSFSFPLVIGLAPVVIFPLSVSYAILRYRVVDTNVIISRALMYTVLTLFAGIGYAALVSGLSLVFNDLISTDNPLFIGVIVFILAFLINPFRSRVQTMVDTIFFRGESVYRQYLETFSAELTQAVDLADISRLIRQSISEHLSPLRLHIFIYDALVDRYVAAGGSDGRPTTDIRFPQNSALVHSLFSKRAVLYLEVDQPFPEDLTNERARIALLGTQLFLALPGQERPSGFLALGPLSSGERYSGQDVQFLTALAEEAFGGIERAQVMADKDRRVHEMNVLTRVAQGVNVTLNFDDILELLYAQTRQVIPVDDFNIILYNQATAILRHVFLVQDEERVTEKEDELIPIGYGLEREVLNIRRHIITDDYQQECRNRRLIPNKENIYAWMGVPLNAGAEIIGVISVGSKNPAILYTDDQYNILQAIADQAAGAIVKARLLEESETRARQLASLNEVTRGLTSTLELDPLLNDIMTSAVEILNCEAGSLLLVDRATNELVFEVVIGPVAEKFLGDRHPLDVGIAGKVATTMEPMIVNNVEQNPDWNAEPDMETGFVTRGMLVVPMHYKGNVIGVLEVLNKKNGMPFTISDQELLNAFAGQAAVAVENVRLYTQTDQELASRVEELSVMQRIDRELNISLDISKAMIITLEWAMRQSRSLAGLIGVLEEGGLKIMASQGYTGQLDQYENDILPLNLPLLKEAVQEGRLLQADTVTLKQSSLHPDAKSQLVVPIRREVEVIGVLLLESSGDQHFDEQTREFLSRLSDHASIAISNAKLYGEVQRANIAKSEFVSFVSHELKTPMTSIRGYADLLAAGSVGDVNEAQTDFLNTIRFNIQRMATLVSDLADISRIEAGRLHLEFAPVHLSEIVDEVIRSTAALAEEKSHHVESDFPGDLPQVWGDRNRLAQVLTNLVSNAIKYTSENGKIIIRGRDKENVWDPEGVHRVVHLQVIDNGIGIKEDDQQKIFQQYFRTEEGRDTAPGTGLGLNITRYLVEMQGGKIWFESVFGRGTNFQFTVPIAEGEEG